MELDQWRKKQFCLSLINSPHSECISLGTLMLINFYSICFTLDNIISMLWTGSPNCKSWHPVLSNALWLDPRVLSSILTSNWLTRNYIWQIVCMLMISDRLPNLLIFTGTQHSAPTTEFWDQNYWLVVRHLGQPELSVSTQKDPGQLAGHSNWGPSCCEAAVLLRHRAGGSTSYNKPGS